MDADTKKLLEQMRTQGGPALHEMPIAAARLALKTLSGALDVPAAAVAQVAEHTIQSSPGTSFRVRVYQGEPVAAGSASRPILLLMHGGGFVLGDLDTHDRMCRYYAAHAGVIVVAVDYRLAPEHPFPAAVDDCYAALEWVARNAAELGGDARRIALTGDSAGGNLAIVIALLAHQRGGPKVARLVPVYPSVDMRPIDGIYPSRAEFGGGGYFLSAKDVDWIRGMYLRNDRDFEDPRVSPILSPDLGSLPPTFLVVAGCDLLRDEAKDLADRMRRAGATVRYRCFEGAIHGFLSFAGVLGIGRQALDEICADLAASL